MGSSVVGQLAGRWDEPTISGERTLEVDGREFWIPEHADVRVVNAGRIKVAHVRHEGRVRVLSARGQLVEDDIRAQSRASYGNWSQIQST